MAKNEFLEKLLKKVSGGSIFSESEYFQEGTVVQTPVPIMNALLSGSMDGGITAGVTTFAGPSKHFKTGFGLLLVKSYLDKFPDANVLMFDSEFGSPPPYLATFGIDTDRVGHWPVITVEELTNKLLNAIDAVERGQKVIIFVDSVGNLASRKELADATEGNEKADMTRAKMIKALFRMTSTKCVMKDIPMIVIAHTYKEQTMYPKDVVSGGTGPYYNSNAILVIGRQQEKDGKETTGFNFVVNVEKSRFVIEKTKASVTVLKKGGIQKYSGLLDLALEGGQVKSYRSKNVMYHIDGDKEHSFTFEQCANNKEFWNDVMAKTDFKEYVKNKFSLSNGLILGENNADGDGTEVDGT